MLWIGERTRQLDGAHVRVPLRRRATRSAARSARRPPPTRSLALCEALNPDRIPGRLTLISRMGADKVETALPPLLRAVRDAGHPVVWACDPMHGNTFTAPSGRKTRHFDAVLSEIAGFFAAHRAGRHLARRRPRRAHRRRRHRVPGRCRGDPRRRPGHPLRDDVRPPAQRPPVARPGLPGGRAAPEQLTIPGALPGAGRDRAGTAPRTLGGDSRNSRSGKSTLAIGRG